MRRSSAVILTLTLTLASHLVAADPWPTLPIPALNAATLRSAPPRPPVGDAEDRARHLATALAGGPLSLADDFFFPREPFLAVKDMSGAMHYFARLLNTYHADVERYRAQLPPDAPVTFVRFVPARACRWMEIGREANRLPYWSCYGARLVVRSNEREVVFRIHVMIHWGTQWFVTHLGPIPAR